MILSILGIRQWLARTIPRSLTLATGAGIGLFIAFIGVLPAGGIGVIGGDYSNMVGLGGCKDQCRYSNPCHFLYSNDFLQTRTLSIRTIAFHTSCSDLPSGLAFSSEDSSPYFS
jgi:xanthine/uracil/vitamin C permease (AzgA family)